MKVLIDGDACPVKDAIYELSREYARTVVLVTDWAHFSGQEPPAHVEVIYVDQGRDAVDFRLLSLTQSGDLVVTQDYGLAALLVPKGARVLHHTGFEYTAANLPQLLASRHVTAQLRQQGQRTKGPKKFSRQDLEKFRETCRQVLATGA